MRLTHSKCEDTSKGRGNATEEVEERVSLADLVCLITLISNQVPAEVLPIILVNLHRVYQVLRR